MTPRGTAAHWATPSRARRQNSASPLKREGCWYPKDQRVRQRLEQPSRDHRRGRCDLLGDHPEARQRARTK